VNILVINVGSTTVKYDLYDMATETCLARGVVTRLESPNAIELAIRDIAQRLGPQPVRLAAIGHRVVHGGERSTAPVRIDAGVEALIEECAVFAPLHNPSSLAGIRAARAAWPDVPHVAVFDTAFHAHLPEHAFVYALPRALYLEHGIRRYGFHGPSHQYMATCAAEVLRTDPAKLRLVTVHLGGGASAAAISGGVSIDTSMGMTPLEGLVMDTRTGDLDPAIPLLLAKRGHTVDQLDELFNRKSGLAGLSGLGSDFQAIETAADGGDLHARLAIDVFVHRIRKYVGAYVAELGGADAVVFAGGIGENSARVRERVCASLRFMGVAIDTAKNQAARPGAAGAAIDVSESHARTRVLVVHAEEEKVIAREVVRCLGSDAANHLAIPIGISARHVHLSRSDCDALFGAGYELARRRDISQPGQYLTRETVDVIGPRGELHNVGIINPLRAETQVELARTDAIHLGLEAPLRESGDLAGTSGVRVRGPRGVIELRQGAIVALRHVHMNRDDARRFGVVDQDVISVRIDGPREVVLGGVVVRVRADFALDLHLDTDEANAAGVGDRSTASFVAIEHHARQRT
jgi:acetate kinase